MYSKYHAVLVIVFVLLSNYKLIFNKKAWLAVILALICYAPHFLWLYQNDFVSITFHLYERPNQAYKFDEFTLGFFLNNIVIIGLLFYWVYGAFFKYKTTDKFSKALIYLVYGILIFFFVSSFNRRVQAQWTIAISIPLAVIAFNHLLNSAKSRKWMYRISIVSFVLLIYARAWMVYYPLFPLHFETHGNKEWVNDLKTKSGGIPVIFENSYRRSSMYEFYSNVPAISLNNFMYRKNQYSIDDSEERVRGKKVLYVSQYRNSGDISYMHLDSTVFHGVYIDDFQSYRKLKCIVEKPGTGIKYSLKVYNPYAFDVPLEQLKYTISYSNKYKQVQQMLPLKVENTSPQQTFLKSKDTIHYSFELPLSNMESPKYFRIGIAENGLLPGLNGKPVKIE